LTNRRQEILDKAKEMFSQRGFHAVSLEDISRSLEMGKSTIYHYFPSKHELWAEVLKDTVAGLYHYVLAKVNHQDPYHEQIRDLVSAILTYFEANRQSFLLLLRERLDFLDLETIKEQFDARFRAEYDQFAEHFRSTVDAGKKAGVLADVDASIILACIFGTINTVVLATVVHDPDRNLTELVDDCYLVIMNGISAV
jgi:TetR/AcrR family transcriptional regulator